MKPEAEAWIAVAEVDFQTAQRLMSPPAPIPQSAGYHAHQCIEKYLKATLEEAGRPVPRTHDLGLLLRMTADLLPDLPLRTDIERIAPYAVIIRYPHPGIDPDELADETRRAVDTMTAVRRVVRSTFGLPVEDESRPC